MNGCWRWEWKTVKLGTNNTKIVPISSLVRLSNRSWGRSSVGVAWGLVEQPKLKKKMGHYNMNARNPISEEPPGNF